MGAKVNEIFYISKCFGSFVFSYQLYHYIGKGISTQIYRLTNGKLKQQNKVFKNTNVKYVIIIQIEKSKCKFGWSEVVP